MARGRRWIAGCAFGFAVLGLFEADAANACSIAAPPVALVGVPVDGATGVPTNARPAYDIYTARLHDLSAQAPQFELVSGSGATVPLAVQRAVWSHFELVPPNELEPLTTYTLRGRWTPSGQSEEVTLTLSFTTGAGRVDSVPAAPSASMRHYRLHGGPSSTCGPPPVGTCVSMTAGTLVQVTYLDSFGQEHGPSSDPNIALIEGYLYDGPFFTDLAGIAQGTNYECVVLRTRAISGSLSQPTVLCGDDAPLFELSGGLTVGCTTDGLTHDGKLVLASESTPGAGCSVTPDRPSVASSLVMLVVGLWGLLRRRRLISPRSP